MAVCIVIVLVMIDPLLAAAALVGLGGVYAVVSVATRERLRRNSKVIGPAYSQRVQYVQEGLGGIRDVLLDQTQSVFAHRFNRIDWALRRAQMSNNIIGPSPRFAVEALGMVLIAALAYHLSARGGGVAAAIPALGALALGAQRLMPLIQQIYQGWVLASGSQQVVQDVVDLLRQPIPAEASAPLARLPFERGIRLVGVSFRYRADLPFVLQAIDLSIPKGARIGLVGTTGSGKSTVMDLVMGLLQPSSGEILVDERPLRGPARLAWQQNIAHVPQAIFLADASFADNIAFGVPPGEIDLESVRQAAQQARIADFIESGPLGYQATVGERGVRLSGGQRQRIGIARALYKKATVLIFDEATSALDSETEAGVMQAIASLGRDLTIVMIAHRLTSLSLCDVIYRLDKGRIAPDMGDGAADVAAIDGEQRKVKTG
jgi:ATP-binding cassette subfamily B protein